MTRPTVCQGCGAPLPEQTAGRYRKWCSQKCRKNTSYGGTCADCGRPTAYNPDGPSKRCKGCDDRMRNVVARRSAVDAIKRFAERYGRPPTATDFNAALSPETFYRDADYPHLSVVQSLFGSWNDAIAAAGFVPRPKGVGGRRYVGDQPGAADEAVTLYRSGLSSRVVAAEMGCSANFVLRKARDAGVVRAKSRGVAA